MKKTENQTSESIKEVTYLEGMRKALELDIEEAAEKLEVNMEKYSKWIRGEGDPSGREREKVEELFMVLSQLFLHCPTKDIILDGTQDPYLKLDQTCPICDNVDCNWKYKSFASLFDFEQVKGPNAEYLFFWVEDDRFVLDLERSDEIEGTFETKDGEVLDPSS